MIELLEETAAVAYCAIVIGAMAQGWYEILSAIVAIASRRER